MCTQVVNNPNELANYYSPQLPESQFCQSCMFQVPNVENLNENITETPESSSDTATETNISLLSNVDNSDNTSSKTTLTLEDQISSLLNSSSTNSEQKKKMMTLQTKSQQHPNTYFISTQFPTNTDIYSSLRQTIVRVFTAETTADLSKPIIFGNSKHGYSIALTFALVDKTARGSERKYSIIITSNWESDLFENYTFILTNLNLIVRNILKTAKAKQVQTDLSMDMPNTDIYLRRSAGLPKAKSMVEILQDEKFFVKIHLWAAFLLDALEDRKHV
jgi:hypothetical protein